MEEDKEEDKGVVKKERGRRKEDPLIGRRREDTGDRKRERERNICILTSRDDLFDGRH